MIVRLPGGEPQPIGIELTTSPLWSPDGTMLIVGHTDQPSGGLVILDRASGEILAEVPTPGRESDPSWQRLAP